MKWMPSVISAEDFEITVSSTAGEITCTVIIAVVITQFIATFCCY